jgi:hypothetical protein
VDATWTEERLEQSGLNGCRGRRRQKRRGTKGDPAARTRKSTDERKPITKLEKRRGEDSARRGNDLNGARLAGDGGITGENATGHGNEREGERRHRNRL